VNARHLLLPVILLTAARVAAAPVAIDLPAGPLGDSVQALGRATGTSIVVDDPAVWRRRVPALRGRMEVRQALRRIAGAAGARVLTAGPGSWRIVTARPPSPRAEPIRNAATAPPPVTAGSTDIVVTASKRDVRLRDLAGQATVLDGDDLAFGGAGGTDSILSRLASVSSTHLGAGRNKLFIRGIADSSFTGPTQSTVGQYLGDLRLTYNAPDPDLRLYDIASVEVLEGPQGTLYGAGSLGGIIRTMPSAPQLHELAGSAAVAGTLTQHGAPGADAAGMLNLPIGDGRGALRLVGYGVSEGGYIDNPVRGEKDINRTRIGGGRAALRLDAGDGWTVDLGGIGQWTHGADSQYADRDGPPLTRSSPVDQGFSASYTLGQVVVSKDWDGLRFRSSAGLIEQRLRERYDAGVPAGMDVPGGAIASPIFKPISNGEARLFVQRNHTRLIASETRLWRPMARGFGWVIGASVTSNRTRLERAVGPVDLPVPVTGVTNGVDEFTLYGEASLSPLPGLTISGGGRVSRSRLSGEGEDLTTSFALAPQIERARAAIVADRSATSLLPSGSVVATILPAVHLFARYQEGFRPGGLAIERDFVRRFQSDRVASLESGVRAGQPGDALDLSVSVSHTIWKDIQADFIDATGLPSTANIGDGRIWAISAAGGWRPAPGLRLDAGVTLNDSKVTEPAVATLELALARMSRVPNVARYAARLGIDYSRRIDDDLTLRLNGWARYVGRSRLGVGPVLGELQGDYLDTALTVRIGRPDWGVTIGATNLTDTVGNRFALGTPFPIDRGQITPLRPRALRIGFDANF
jgi:outer membrane receptor protein involved in Fe transport